MTRSTDSSGRLLGFLAALAACGIAAGWQISTRSGVITGLDPLDLALLRYGVPGLVLMPLWLKSGLLPKGLPRSLLAFMVLGAGLPFGLLVMVGAQFAPVSHMAVLLPGTMPLFVALLAHHFLSEALSGPRLLGFAFILGGVGLIGLDAVESFSLGTWKGDLILLIASLCWGIYSVAYRKSGLAPWTAAAVISGWSLLLVVPFWLIAGGGRLFEADAASLGLQLLWQGILAGVLGLWVYGYAVRAIGATRAAAIGALVPAMAAIGGLLFLAEPLSLASAIGVACVSLGVLAGTGLFARG